MRKSILACTVSFLMSPVASWALGMGDIQVNSTLNQPLNAEIALHSVAKKDLDTLRVGLAPKSIYSRASIERSEYLSKFSFKVIQRGGKNYIAITTRKPFKEPFANFLIEATWGSGRLLREYTMLLDPPEFVKKQARAVTTASASRSSQVKRSTAKTVKKPSTSTKSSYVLTPVSDNGELSYGPTKRNDTLWAIAKKMAPENISVDQMMMAILRDNSSAFIDNNINNLKAGYVLRIKDRDSLNNLSPSMARRQVREQYQSWKNTRKQKTSANVVDRSIRAPEAASTEGQLKLVTSGSTDKAGAEGDLSSQAKQLKEKLLMAGEELESKEVQNQELRTRIKELEELLKTKASLVQLKDESLAALQRQKQIQQESDPESTIESITEEAAIEVPVETTSDKDVYEVTKALLSQHIDPSVELSKDEMITEILSTTEPADIEEALAQPEPAAVAQPEPKPTVKPEVKEKPVVKSVPKPVVKQAPKPLPQENVIDVLLGKDMLPYTAGGGALLVLIFAWLGLRGRGKKDNEFEESILDSQIADDESDFSVEDSELVESNTEVLTSDNETSFLSDFSADDMESLQPDDTEADPISEADVFMVYGRYQQAEELLQGAIKDEPERLDFQMKLLEVYHGDNLKDSFAIQADVVKGLLQKSNDDFELTSEWTKAKSWAEKLDLNIDMPDSFDEDTSLDEDKSVNELDDSELSLDDLSDDLALDSEELNLNEDSILRDDNSSDDDFSLTLDEAFGTEDNSLDGGLELESIDESSELSHDDLDNKTDSSSSNDVEDDFELSLEELDSGDGTEPDSDELLDIDESTLNLDEDSSDLDNSLELEDNDELNDSLELDLGDDLEDSLELDAGDDLEESLELDAGDDLEESLELDAGDDLEESLELDAGDDLEESLELDAGDDLEESLELDAGDDLDDSLELDVSDDLDDSDASLATSDDDLDLFDSESDFEDLEDDFPELDAVGTKLDLAKAYIDMGDMESANSILNEVIDEGDENQKSQAQSLLDQAAI